MARKKSAKVMKTSVSRQVKAGAKGGKLDLKVLRETNAPLAAVLNEFAMAKTGRDDPTPVAKDLARVIDARDPKSRLGKALAALERHLAAPKPRGRSGGN